MNTINNPHHISFLLTITSLFTFHMVCNALDTINMTQMLRDGETMISSGGSFELGFFSPGNSTSRYVGIWYGEVTVRTVVWVANREVPLTNTSGLLRLRHPGILGLEDESGSIFWSTNDSQTPAVPNLVVQLLDSGNLVVKDANDDNPDNFLWRSFSYPSDTLLPGMKLGWNLVTDEEVYLSSWKSDDDPAPGNFTYHLETTGYPQLVLRRDGVGLHRSGPWNGFGFNGESIVSNNNSVYRYDVVRSQNELYYHYELLNSSVITRLTLSPYGTAGHLVWRDQTESWSVFDLIPRDMCDIYNRCGVYGTCDITRAPSCGCLGGFFPIYPDRQIQGNWSDGCVRREQFDCGQGDIFVKYSGLKLPDARRSRFNMSLTLNECENLCARDCSCMAYTTIDVRSGESGCLVWRDELLDIKNISDPQNTQDFYIRMGSSLSVNGPSARQQQTGILAMIISIIMGLVLLGVGLIMMYAWRKKKIKSKQRKSRGLHYGDQRRKKDLELPLFDFITITKATDNFSINNKLGEGGYGPVYKGMLEEGQEVAVKRLSKTSYQGVDEFMNEVICIAKLQHRNLVKLLGCCIQGEENILVYECMCNKSLDFILFDPARSTLLDWPKRFHIINGIARGLMYLHQDSRLRIIHRDLKASNVLLDSDMNPKISDFGLARSFGGNETGANTNRVVGTYGYMAPEYAAEGLFSVKSDVFSFGVLALEIVTGKRNKGFTHMDRFLNLLGYAWILCSEGRLLELVDPCLGSSYNISEVTRSIQIGLLCVQQCAEDRPNMSAVVLMLANESVLPQANQPGFFTGGNVISDEIPINSNPACSTNEMSLTLPEGR